MLKPLIALGLALPMAAFGADQKNDNLDVEQPSSQPVANAEGAAETQQSRIHLGVNLFYDFSNRMEADSVSYSVSNASASGSAKADLESGAGLGIEANVQTHITPLKFAFGIDYEFPRAITSQTLNVNGASASGSVATAKLGLLILKANAIYQVGPQYAFAGLNAAQASISAASGYDFQPVTGIGGQVGGGYTLNEHLVAELEYRLIGFTLQETGPSNLLIQFNRTTVSNLLLRLKYVF